jgi:hypothetical protein
MFNQIMKPLSNSNETFPMASTLASTLLVTLVFFLLLRHSSSYGISIKIGDI